MTNVFVLLMGVICCGIWLASIITICDEKDKNTIPNTVFIFSSLYLALGVLDLFFAFGGIN